MFLVAYCTSSLIHRTYWSLLELTIIVFLLLLIPTLFAQFALKNFLKGDLGL
jgi:hypothetical protein